MNISELEAIIEPVEAVTLDQSIPDYPILVVKNTGCEAKVALHGAHLFEWTPTAHQPVIYTSPEAIYRDHTW